MSKMQPDDDVVLSASNLTARLQLALDAAQLGTWSWDMATGVVTWDDRMHALFGFAPGEFDGTFEAYRAALHPDDRDEVLATVDRAVQSRERYRVEHRVVRSDGTVRWVQGAGATTLSEDGSVTGAIGCSMDVTDRVEARLAKEAAARDAAAAADRERADRERFEFLAAVSELLAEAHSRADIMRAVTRAAVPRLGDWCSIYVVTEAGSEPEVETFHVDPAMVEYARELTVRFPYDPDAPTGVAAVIRTGTADFVPEITRDVVDEALAESQFGAEQEDELREVLDRLALRSAITVPLVKHGRILGALSFVNTTDRRAFTDQDLSLAEVVAGRVAASLENRRLSDEQHRIATTLQRSLLPERLPDVPGLDVAVRYWAAGEASEVGGDFYDLFAVEDGVWATVIGDVCGTGPEAAAVTGLARHTIRQAAWRGDTPSEVLQWLNRAVIASVGQAQTFLTTSFGRWTANGDGFDVTIANAGHPPPVLVRPDGRAEALGANGQLVGVFATHEATEVTYRVTAGDTIVFYTDGLTDVPPPFLLDTEQTVELIGAAARGNTAEATAHALQLAVEERMAVQHRPDDIALMVLHVTG